MESPADNTEADQEEPEGEVAGTHADGADIEVDVSDTTDKEPEVPAATYRFPYPPLHVAGLVLAVLFVFGYSYYTLNSLKGLAPGQPLKAETGQYVVAMFGLSAFLATFIAGALLSRGALRFEITGDSAVLHRLRIRRAARRVEIPWDTLRAEVGADYKGNFQIWLRWPDGTQKLPLPYAVRGEGAAAERIEGPGKEAEAREHPLVRGLMEKLGARLSWR